MKKLPILSLALAAGCLLACSGNNAKYDITGTNAPQDGAAVYLMDLIEENQDNLIPVVFLRHIPSLAGKEKFDELISADVPYASHPYTLELKRRLDASTAEQAEAESAKDAIIGQKFLDLEEADPNGKMHKLSEFVGRGQWVLVDFWASWCGPCRMLAPVIEKLSEDYAGRAVFGKVNVDDEQELAVRYNVMSIPTIIFFKNGVEIDRKIGVQPPQAFAKVIDENQ